MPLHMEARDISDRLDGVASVLIVSCPICPPISVAMQQNAPYIELFKHGLNTEVFEDYIKSIREPLEQRGVRTGVYRSYVPSPTMCLWTRGQRERFRREARAASLLRRLPLGCLRLAA